MKLNTAILFVTLMLGAASAQDVKLHPDSGTTDQDQLAKDILALDKGIVRVGEALNHAAAVIKREHKATWSLPDDRLLALLNANVQKTLAIAAAKDKAATEINSLLNQLNIARYTNRAPVGMGREDVRFDSTASRFVIVPATNEPSE